MMINRQAILLALAAFAAPAFSQDSCDPLTEDCGLDNTGMQGWIPTKHDPPMCCEESPNGDMMCMENMCNTNMVVATVNWVFGGTYEDAVEPTKSMGLAMMASQNAEFNAAYPGLVSPPSPPLPGVPPTILPATTIALILPYLTHTISCSDPAYEPGYCKNGMLSTDVGGGGDPHFKTWSGAWFDFHGECDLLLVDAPKFQEGLGLSVHIRTKIRQGYSYIETAAIKIGDDVVEVSSWGVYSLNGVDSARLPKPLSNGYMFTLVKSNKKESVFRIHQANGKGESIEIKSFKDMVSVNLENPKSLDFADSVGILGSFQGSRLGRDGVTLMEDDSNAFAQEWQIRPEVDGSLFETVRHPQFPLQCIMPEVRSVESRRLRGGISDEAAADACAKYTDSDAKARCVFDVLATQDLEAADAGAF